MTAGGVQDHPYTDIPRTAVPLPTISSGRLTALDGGRSATALPMWQLQIESDSESLTILTGRHCDIVCQLHLLGLMCNAVLSPRIRGNRTECPAAGGQPTQHV